MKTPSSPPDLTELFSSLGGERLQALLPYLSDPTVKGRYFHWDDLRRRQPPDDLSREEWWMTLKFARSQGRRTLPLIDTSGRAFTYIFTDDTLSMLHRIDRFASGRIAVPEAIVSESTRNQYLVSSLMEEAVASSLLEGAATTRREAKRLLRSGRAPRTTAERMVVNNYMTMQMIRTDLADPLTTEMVLDIHRTVTQGTLENFADAGRMQQPGEKRVDVGDPFDAAIVFHRPPRAEDLPGLLDGLVAFANDVDSEPFIHPVVRAVALHFGLSYIHPFVDGNGRTARALFYRSMLRQGYWLSEYISISRLLMRAPAQYGRAFLHTETDEADFTYFLLHQLKIICRAIDELFEYLDSRVAVVRKVERALRKVHGLNHRQHALLSNALTHPDAVYTIKTHSVTHDVVYQTARMDLLDLEALGYLSRHMVGREYWFHPIPDLSNKVLRDS